MSVCDYIAYAWMGQSRPTQSPDQPTWSSRSESLSQRHQITPSPASTRPRPSKSAPPAPCGRISAATSRAIASPSSAARLAPRRGACARRRVRHAHAGHLVGHELRVPEAFERRRPPPAPESGTPRCASRNRESAASIEHRLRDRELRARLHLVLEPPHLLIEVERAGVGGDADVERGRHRRSPGRRCRARGSAGARRWSARSSRRRTRRSRRDSRPPAADRR